MAADLLDERHDCGADAPQGAEYTSDGTPCVLQMKAKCAGDAVGGSRVSEKISTFLRENRAGPSTTIKRLSWTPLDDIIRGNAALDALDSKLLRVQQNHAYRPIARKCAGCATPPVGDTSISPVLGDDAGFYTPFEPSDSTPTQKIEQTYQIPHIPSEPSTTNDRLPTKAPKTTNAPEHGTVNATEPSRATACKGAPEDPTKSGSICQNNILPSETIFIAPQQGAESSVPTSQTKECPTQPLDAHGFPDICASTSTAGQAIGNDGAGGYSGGSDTPCATPIVHLATDDVWYDCPPTDQDILDEDPTVSYPTKFGHADAVETSAQSRFLDGGASRDAPRICTPSSLDGKALPESSASMYITSRTRSLAGSPTFSDASTLIDPVDALMADRGKCDTLDSSALSIVPTLHHASALPKTTEFSSEARLDHDDQMLPTDTSEVACNEQLNQDISSNDSSNDVFEPATESLSLQTTLGPDVPPELFETILSYIWDIVWRPGARVDGGDYRALGYLALVSRYWAKQIRHLILERLVIHDSRGVERMKAVLNPSMGFGFAHPATLIRDLRLMCSDSNPWWIHQVTRIVQDTPVLARNVTLSLTLVNYRRSLGSSPNCPPTIFYYLPKTWPMLFRQFYHLTLKDVHFNQASEMFRLVSDMHNLRTLRLDNVSWCSSSPYHSQYPVPACLKRILISDEDRFGLGGRGILPWVLANSIDFLTPQKVQPAQSLPPLPPLLRPHPWSSIPLPLTHPSQYDSVLQILDVLTYPGVSPSLEPLDAIEWDIGRSKTGDFGRPLAAKLYIDAKQRRSNRSSAPVAVHHLALSLEARGGNNFHPEHLYVTQVSLEVGSYDGTPEELTLYDWRVLIQAAAQFQFLEAIDMCFATAQQCSRMVLAHGHFIGETLENRMRLGMEECTYSYSVEDEGVQWTCRAGQNSMISFDGN